MLLCFSGLIELSQWPSYISQFLYNLHLLVPQIKTVCYQSMYFVTFNSLLKRRPPTGLLIANREFINIIERVSEQADLFNFSNLEIFYLSFEFEVAFLVRMKMLMNYLRNLNIQISVKGYLYFITFEIQSQLSFQSFLTVDLGFSIRRKNLLVKVI